MFSRHITVLAVLGLVVGQVVGDRGRRSVYYHGPPAPLNHDGTVAYTPEVRNAAAAQKSAFAAEFNRLQEVGRLAAAHLDYTSYSKGNQNLQNYNQGTSYNYGQFYNPAPLNPDGTVALTPEVQQARAAHQAAFAAEYQRYQEAARLAAAHPDLTSPRGGYGVPSGQQNYNQQSAAQYNQHSVPQYNQHSAAQYNQQSAPKYNQYSGAQYNQYSTPQYKQQHSYTYNPAARIPAPLNHDGTVAQTPEYRAIAAAHQAEFARALQNTKYQNSLAQYNQGSSYNKNYW